MIDFEKDFQQLSAPGNAATFKDFCHKDPGQKVSNQSKYSAYFHNVFLYVQTCRIESAMPIDLVYDLESDSYDLSKYVTDDDLIKRVQQGYTEKKVYRTDIVQID